MSDSSHKLARQVLTDPVHFVAFGFGTGLSPVAPGTVGSLLGILLACAVLDLGFIHQIGLAAGLCVAGIWICGKSAKKLGIHDHVCDGVGGSADDPGLDTRISAVSSLRYRETVADSGPGSQNGRRSGNYAG